VGSLFSSFVFASNVHWLQDVELEISHWRRKPEEVSFLSSVRSVCWLCYLLSVITDMNIISYAMLWISVPWRSLLMAGHVP